MAGLNKLQLGVWGLKKSPNPYLEGLVAHYSMDEESGSLVADLTGNYNGTTNGIRGIDGVVSKGINCTPNQYITFSDLNNGITSYPFVFKGWFYYDGSNQSFFLSGNVGGASYNYYGLNLSVDSNGSIQLSTGDGNGPEPANRRTYISDVGVANIGWNHIIVNVNSFNDYDFYLNSSLITMNYLSGTATSMSFDCIWGAFRFTINNYYNGKSDEYTFWQGRTFSNTEVNDIYATELSGSSIF